MAQVVSGRYTARMDESFVVFIIGMWLPLHKDPPAVRCEVIQAKPAVAPYAAHTVQID